MTHYDVYAIGNALVDSEYEVTDAQLQAMKVQKRHMTLIDAARRAELLAHVKGAHSRKSGGGSAGNTIVAVAQLGGRAFYSCRVVNDELGQFYVADLQSNGVASNLTPGNLAALGGMGQTGDCMVMVTPDAERSMSTFLGATAELDHTALDPIALAASRVYYMEGYLAASPTGLDAALRGRAIARQAGVKLATTLSDMSMINFCRPGLEAMVGDGIDYLFCNEEEAQTWCASQDLGDVVAAISPLAKTVCLTRGAQGCLVLESGEIEAIPAAQAKAIDTNGAGDMFAGAFLYAATQGRSHAQSAWLANQAAGQVVSQYGNRLTRQAMGRIEARFHEHVTG